MAAESKENPAAAAAAAKMEESMLSPGFRSVAQMAGWDEETLLLATLVVEDTPDRQIKHKRRTDLHFKTPPPSNSRRKRRVQRRSPTSIPVTVLDLDLEDEDPKKVIIGSEKEKIELDKNVDSEKKKEDVKSKELQSAPIPCMDKLREELSCAICLEICFEPSTTPCGHSFCKKCLRSAADKCGKRCPKCRQLISNGRSCAVNTVLWNTIQLLFPKEVETRKASGSVDSRESKRKSLETRNIVRSLRALDDDVEAELETRNRVRSLRALDDDVEAELETSARRFNHNLRNRSVRPSGILTRRRGGADARNSLTRRREQLPVQDEDAALALRLQREEFMEAFRPSDEQHEQEQPEQEQQPPPPQHTSSSIQVARANLRAMASRAMNIRVRGRQN